MPCPSGRTWIQLRLGPKSDVLHMGFPDDSVVKNLPTNAGDVGDTGSIPGSGGSPGGGNGNPLQYCYLGNLMDRAAWWATVHVVTKDLDMT